MIKTSIDLMFAFGNGTVKLGIYFTMSGIETAITDHLKVFFGYVANKTFDEIDSGNRFFHVLFIFVAVVVESNVFAIIFINSGSGNNRSSKIATDIFDDSFGIAKVWFCKNIKTILMIVIEPLPVKLTNEKI